jgi:uncharacterized SAM-binding protein YcdF (DUF218 family)
LWQFYKQRLFLIFGRLSGFSMSDVFKDIMSVVHTLFIFLVIPPTGFLWLAILGAALIRFRPRLGGTLAVSGLVGLYALGTPFVSYLLLEGLEAAQPHPSGIPEPAAIIILGGDGERVHDVQGNAEPGVLSLQRLAGAAGLARRTGLPILITGGSVGTHQAPIADLMTTVFTDDFGLPVKWIENRASNTCQNATFSAAILRQAGIPSAWVVTNSWHMPRALLSFSRAGYPVLPAPLPADFVEIRGVFDLLPHANGWNRSYFAIHEWIGLIAYRLGACPLSAPEVTAAASPQ